MCCAAETMEKRPRGNAALPLPEIRLAFWN
jgi:hypothetical protein